MEQPRGIRAFGWGLLGYIGANLIINITTAIGGAMGSAAGGYQDANGGHFLGFTLGMIFAWMFADSRNYRATATGAQVAFWLAILGFIVGFLGAL